MRGLRDIRLRILVPVAGCVMTPCRSVCSGVLVWQGSGVREDRVGQAAGCGTALCVMAAGGLRALVAMAAWISVFTSASCR